MTTAPFVERAPAEALELSESVSLLEGMGQVRRFTPVPGSVFDSEGRVPIVIIRPGIGKGRGRHLYEARMLQDNAEKFTGWKMFVNHLAPEAKKAAGGLPRDVRDLGGRITEAWWEPSFPADSQRGFEQGAVVGLAKPVPFIRELIENDPEILEASIAATATGVRPVMAGGSRAWCVEGIQDRGTVDWVTEAGAGGRVAQLLEAAYAEETDLNLAVMESLSDDEFSAYVRENRPTLDLNEGGQTNTEGDGDMADITPEALQEAISASPTLLVEALQQSAEAQDFLRGLVEASMEQEREVVRAEVRAEVQRDVLVRDMRDAAHKQIRESRLPESWKAGLYDKFSLTEAGPSDALDVVDEVDDDGEVVKPAMESLAEAVTTAIQADFTRLRDVTPTTVRNQGPSAGTGGASEKYDAKQSGWGRYLQESASVDPNDAYALNGAGENA